MNKIFKDIKNWIKNNKQEFVFLALILLIGTFLRMYRISDYMTFLGDEGRDAIIVRNLLVKFDPILIGPRTSIGDMYLGPLYYYLIAPALLIANFSPVGPSVLVAMIGVGTIFLIWQFTREVLGYVPARIASFLFAISPVVIKYSSSSWNPNVMPFFSLLTIYSLWKIWIEKKFVWMIVAVISYAFVLNSHYLGLLLLPTIFLIVFFNIRRYFNSSYKLNFLRFSIASFALFFLLMSPLVIFDTRHGWRNFSSMKKFFTERQTTVSARPWTGLPKLFPIFRDDYITRIITASNKQAGFYVTWTLTGFITMYFVINYKIISQMVFNKKKQISVEPAFFLLIFSWILFSFIGMSVYKQHVYDHYFGFVYPAGFLMFAMFYKKMRDVLGDTGLILSSGLVLLLSIVNIIESPIRYAPNMQLQRARQVALHIQENADNKKLNLAVVAERNYEDGYQYFLEKNGVNVVDIDAQNPDSIANQLFVVCELNYDLCDPVNNPKAEVANFGWSKVEEYWTISGVTVFKLIHNK